MIVLGIFSLLLSWLTCFVLIRQAHLYSATYSPDLPQRFHLGDVPRLGGLAIAASCFVSWLFASALWALGSINNVPIYADSVWQWLAIASPVLLAGLLDDATQKVSIKWRLLASCLSAAMACLLMDLVIPRLGVAWIDQVLQKLPFLGIALAFVAISGLPHAFNIIDGYNGLASMVALMVCSALLYVALLQGDRQLAGMLACVIGASLGFLFWNYPRGLIFAGDGGSYFWGLVVAVASIELVRRHAQVSPWFPMLLLIYPVWETLFSIYRKLARGQSPGVADSMHFHQLVYKRLVRGVFHDNATRQMLMRNNRTSPYLWAMAGLTVTPAVLFWYSTPALIFFCALFIVTYVTAYVMIVRFKVPAWLKLKQPAEK
jgi:UDP-GlcNAc:undecaprenyl-phosphate/decaprenyl-phosphate GlcNAc-1-phosphate transferase